MILVRGVQWSFDPKGRALSPKFAQNMGFPLKLPENCMILNKSWGQGGPGPPGPRRSTAAYLGLGCHEMCMKEGGGGRLCPVSGFS